ncbi:sensor domain-containing diguanylate cyclase [Bradyrhizobium canariense]|uniref:diguanylate cyclase n=1 Tax=Bradyrhizobium canariense TaxID=255045 RepID=A0A1H1YE32_9BRAD|nr:diguanylate cyclase [Bradyrhizobium canariense]SDT19778.1 PAS domain S-box-containing protein/diguanylate cyclase (GGDEF) domain-containing protein [Bradyrhizobium canariense]
MPDHASATSTLSRQIAPAVIATLFALAMSACVLGVVIWKALESKSATLERGQTATQNLAHSLAEHASHTIQAADISMSGIVELLKYRTPLPDRMNPFLANIVNALPQIREIGVLSVDGAWQYSSLSELPRYNNSDRDYFIYHRDTPGAALRISAPIQSRLTGHSTIMLSKRISKEDGSFGGVLLAAIDSDYFNAFYNRFQLGVGGAIGLMRNDGIVLIRWPSANVGADLSKSDLFARQIKLSSVGYYKTISPFDGTVKYFGYEETSQYPLVVTVARSESELLASWWATLRTDALVGAVLLCLIILSAALLWSQFRFRMKTEHALREREARYRLLSDNIADIVILLDGRGTLLYVSPSVEPVLGLRGGDLIGKSCFDLVHPDDKELVLAATARPSDPDSTNTVAFRIARADRSVAWVEINFKLASEQDGQTKFVGVLRDVTQRKMMEDELTSLNTRLAQLATTDGLTGLCNRRTFDGFLRREYAARDTLSVLLFDIDNFKGYNDSYGHQAGDECLKAVAKVIADATSNTSGMSARYGGEEFIIVLPDVSEADALRVAEAVRLTIRALGIPNSASSRGYVTVSGGVSTKTKAILDEAMLVGDADLALYEAKRLGRNRTFASSELKHSFVESVPLQFLLEP